MADRGLDLAQHLVPCHLELEFHMQVRGGDKRVDPRPFRVLHRLRTPGRYRRAASAPGRRPSRSATIFATSVTASKSPSEAIGKACLDDVHAHLVEQLRDLQLLGQGHRGAGRLLAIAHRGVEDLHAVLSRPQRSVCSFIGSVLGLCRVWVGRRCSGHPPRAAPRSPAPSEADKKQEPARESRRGSQTGDVTAIGHGVQYSRTKVKGKREMPRACPVRVLRSGPQEMQLWFVIRISTRAVVEFGG